MNITVVVYIEADSLRDAAIMKRFEDIEEDHAARANAAQKLTKWTEMEFVSEEYKLYCMISIYCLRVMCLI